MNRVVLMGNLTRDPDVRMTNGGVSVCTFTLAVQRRFADSTGEKQTDFFNIVCWRALAENCGKYLQKGSRACVSGMLQNRSYEANDGARRYVTEIVADEVEFITRAEKKEAEPVGEPIDDELPF